MEWRRVDAHEVVADTLRRRIDSGALRQGARIPTQKELAEEFGVNRSVIRHALKELQGEGRLTDTGRGAPPFVADVHLMPKPAGSALAAHLYEAFCAEHVTIDAYSLTTETLNNALARPKRAIADRVLTPRSITVRAIVPSQESWLALPRHVIDPADDRPMMRFRDLQRTWASALRATISTLMERTATRDVSCEIRTVASTPLHKVYILNGTQALMAHYTVVSEEVAYRGEMFEIFDVLGFESPLFHFSAGAESSGRQDAAIARNCQEWFDSLWNTIAVPLPPEGPPDSGQ